MRELKDALGIYEVVVLNSTGMLGVLLTGPRYGHSCVTMVKQEYPSWVEDWGRERFRYRREQVEMLGSTQERCSKIPEGEDGSWLKGISELTKSREIQAVHYHYIKGMI